MTVVPKEPHPRQRTARTAFGGPAAPVLTGVLGGVSAWPAPAELAARLRTAVRTGYWTRLVPLLALLAGVLHLPSFDRSVWSPDEGYLATQARMLADGGVLYDTVVDRKPPLLPWLYEGMFWLFGSTSLWPLRLLAIGAHTATAAILAAIGRERWGRRAGAAAGAAYLVLSIGLSPEDTQAATFEVFMLPATAAAFWFATHRRWAAAGAAAAVAALTKQTAGAVLLPALWLAWRATAPGLGRRPWAPAAQGPARLRPRLEALLPPPRRVALVRLSAGFLVPITVVALATGPKQFVFWVVSGSSGYASPDGAWAQMAARAFGNLGILVLAGLGVLLPLLTGLRASLRADADLWAWLAASALGVLTGFHFFGHYYLQLLPALALLAVGALHRADGRRRLSRFAVAWSAAAAAGFVALGLAWPHQPLERDASVAADVHRETSPQETVLVWGMHPEIYWLADREPGTRYLTAGLLTNFAGGRTAASVGTGRGVADSWAVFQQEMDRQLPEVFVDDSLGAPYAPNRIGPIRRLLALHYIRVGVRDGAVIYRLRPTGPQPLPGAGAVPRRGGGRTAPPPAGSFPPPGRASG